MTVIVDHEAAGIVSGEVQSLDRVDCPVEDRRMGEFACADARLPAAAGSLLDQDERDLVAAARRLEGRVAASIAYTRSRHAFFRTWASLLRIAAVALSATATRSSRS